MRWLALLLLLPLAGAVPETIGEFGMQDHFTATHGVLMTEGDGLASHQDVTVVYSNMTGTLLETSSIHEHDGLALMRWTAGNTTARVGGTIGGVPWASDISVSTTRTPNDGSLESIDGTSLVLEGPRLGVEKSNSRGIRGTWVLRDEMGPVLMGGLKASGFFEHELAVTHAARPLAGEMTLVGRIGSRTIMTEGEPPASQPAPPSVETLLLEACGPEVVLDPPTPIAGSVMQVAVVGADRRPATAAYELVRIDTPEEQLMHRWSSTTPYAHTAFRLPEGSHELRVTQGAETCKVPLEATESASGTTPLTVNVTASNGTLDLVADVEAAGHYEYHVSIHLDRGETTGSRLVWEGKLHGHDGPVSLQAHQLPNATYEVVIDAWPQAAGPLVENGAEGHRVRLPMAYPESAPEPIKTSPAPGLLWLAVGLLLARRR